MKYAQLLKQHGAKLKIFDANGSSLLHVACEEGHEELAKWLLDRDLDADRLNKDSLSPLDLASPELKKKLEKYIEQL
ncbi:hypothetical protein K502DRAFT_322828 [Neoconidiobolus thromboides FSU 785]|nr:hypothetical protein K502DRAFT_322828 [Neoconidiobolus thromboides FSU 785]